MARRRKQQGGSVAPSSGNKNVHKFNPAAPTYEDADKKGGGFARGGRHNRKAGGPVEGKKFGGRLDKRARGGRMRAMASGGVISSAGSTSAAKVGGENN